MTHATTTSIRHSIAVEAPIERAFEVFTRDFGAFKPPEHNLLQRDRRDDLRAVRRRLPVRPRHRWQRVPVGARARL